ncbi:TetR/AcrR family transcriptional regulator [Nocardiopsis potens]|uniref:TetR/AcrR family transcriptional regulator n=1 Tax=Nocardiopsis potens TaxID=1246458 RepID=UPI00034DD9EB|nr:TetR/AcrR family transcriptional regulator [Nocardiopsis potens]
MDTTTTDRARVLEAADALFYAHGIQAVGMDRIRDAARLPLKRLYRAFPSKAALVEAYLRHRDSYSRAALREHTDGIADPRERILAVFDWLHAWCGQPEFRGCAFANAYGELGEGAEGVHRAVRDHMDAVSEQLYDLAAATTAPDPRALGRQLHILLAGTLSLAAVQRGSEPALQARAAARALLDALPGDPLPPEHRTPAFRSAEA